MDKSSPKADFVNSRFLGIQFIPKRNPSALSMHSEDNDILNHTFIIPPLVYADSIYIHETESDANTNSDNYDVGERRKVRVRQCWRLNKPIKCVDTWKSAQVTENRS